MAARSGPLRSRRLPSSSPGRHCRAKDGRTIRTTQIEALAQQLTRKALQGDMKAAKLLFDTIKALAPATEFDGMSPEERLAALDDRPKLHPGIEVRFVDAGDMRSRLGANLAPSPDAS
ncbi:DUF5681 domain-containing protein [Methylobacterium sp. Leaf91]|uniref:DUF5681 domain-containing protein n=1 Tax=Methylobacterium sp. Leaf91 TaxID=1736247 RepID=UPI00244ED4FE|nr:DUF5681 domain-containing protein [Methylobacterium sp. Leaf91]